MKSSPSVEILEEDDKVFGLILAATYTAEHEWGISGLQDAFGCPIEVDKAATGIEARTITTPFETLSDEWVHESHVIFETNLYADNTFRKRLPRQKTSVAFAGLTDIRRYSPEDKQNRAKSLLANACNRHLQTQDFTAAWDDKSFLIAGWTERAHQILSFLDKGVQTNDFAIWLGGAGSNPFARSGLVLARPSLVPQVHKETMLKADLDRLELSALANATGIQEKINAKNKAHNSLMFAPHRYSSLSPRLTPDDKKSQTQHPVIFFLSPFNTKVANCGWFTVEELEQWLDGKGPITNINERLS